MQQKFIGLYRWICDQYMANANFMVDSQETARRHLAQDNMKNKTGVQFNLNFCGKLFGPFIFLSN